MSHRKATFEIDDSAITERGFTYRSAYPAELTGNSFILTNTDTLCIKVYSNNQTGGCFAVGFGQFIGKHWIHVVAEESGTWDSVEYAQEGYDKMLARAPEHARSLHGKVHSGSRVYIMQTRLHQLTLRTCVVRKSSREIAVKLEVFQDPGFNYVSGEWTDFDIGVGRIFPVSAHYLRISIDITHRKQNIKTCGVAPPHSKSTTVQSPSVASLTATHTQRNSQEIILFSPTQILFASESILITKPVVALQWASDNSLETTGYMSFLRNLTRGTLSGRNMPKWNTTKCCPARQGMRYLCIRRVRELRSALCKPVSIN